MGMFSPPSGLTGPSGGYTVIGGGAYQAGSAAAKKAQELYNQWLASQPRPVATVPSPSVPTVTPSTQPATFPTYSTTAGGVMTPANSTLAPGPATSGKGAYGLVPTVPNPGSTAAGSIANNQANLPALTTLGQDTTKLNANLAQMPFQMNLPGYGGMLGQASQNISSNLAGVIDPQQWAQLQQRLAERGVRTGMSPGSPNANTALMTALNQSIIGTQNLGQQQLNAAIGRTPTGQMFNTAGQMISPADVQAAQYQANLFGAAPDPTLAAQANLDTLLKAIEAGRVGGFSGSGGGGVGGVPRLSSPSIPAYYPVGGGYSYPVGNYSAPGYAPRMTPTAPGSSASDQWVQQYMDDFANASNPSQSYLDYTYQPEGTGNDFFAGNYGNNWLEQYLNDWEQGY